MGGLPGGSPGSTVHCIPHSALLVMLEEIYIDLRSAGGSRRRYKGTPGALRLYEWFKMALGLTVGHPRGQGAVIYRAGSSLGDGGGSATETMRAVFNV